jgi:hypothetical protein
MLTKCADPARRRGAGELAAAILTGAAFLVFENVLHLKLPFLLAAAAGWGTWIALRVARDRTVLREWGIRWDTFRAAAVPGLAFFLAGCAAIAAWRVAFGWKPLPAGALLLAVLYPLWSFVQQFLLQAIVAGNLERLGLRRIVVIPIAAAAFGLVHAPDLRLMGLCALAGIAWTAIYLRHRNLFVPALAHAWLGALAYYWVLDRDPWIEMLPPA